MEPPRKRLKHAPALFLGGVRWEWRKRYSRGASGAQSAEAVAAAWLKEATAYDGDVTVAIEETESCLVGTARFHGYGDAPFVAARAILGRCTAQDPSNGMLMFQEVKPHRSFAEAEGGRRREAAGEAAAAERSVPLRRREPWPNLGRMRPGAARSRSRARARTSSRSGERSSTTP